MQNFRAGAYQVASFTVIKVSGELDAMTSDQLRELATGARTQPTHGIIFDLADMTFIDSSGIRVILDTTQHSDGIRSAVASLSPRVERLFARLGLTTRLAIYATTLDAVRSLTPDAP